MTVSGEQNDRRVLLTIVIVGIIAFTCGDMFLDYGEQTSYAHITTEVVLVSLCVYAIFLIWRDSVKLGDNLRALSREMIFVRQDAQKWRAEAQDLLIGMSAAIERQFNDWGLTEAEKEIGFLLLKGMSFKEVSGIRGTSERTVRQQAQVVYAKSGVAGRAELSAFFLEDLLLPG
ncbi:MAG: LuxR family transcriptional regulator [Pseudomonadota bacterium]